ncbi:MAG: tRNA uridine-5-carboxymethylaminomethyl(34) synthesis GTPase MnmE [Lentisphaerae bacterium GWF2_45_14]|nr:MAG: tRNA uridine-5-carboxymethylaminomethyl(34) synthesis GTPase MnmE [Lentisphaerae bacterium GWF2_45_14]
MNTEDTIAAVSSGTGGAVSIIRISGPGSLSVSNHVWKGGRELELSRPRMMMLGKIINGPDNTGDPAMAVYMPGPNSYTGDDVVEIHCHGGALCTRRALELVLSNGARAAGPGEFTYRAFVNGKMDLTQAEAVADLISAHSDMAMRMAESQIAGRLRDSIRTIRDELVDMLSECESRMDFPEENLDWTASFEMADTINLIAGRINSLCASSLEGSLLREGVSVVIAGRPNVGKSSLLNLMLGFDRAIVTQVPGTTRDTIEELAHVRGIPVRLTDTAGIRETDNLVEVIGIDRSRSSMRQAHLVIWLLDSSTEDIGLEISEMQKHLPENINVICAWNKSDLASGREYPSLKYPSVQISVKEETGIEKLLDIFENAVWGYPHTAEPEFAVSARHASLLQEAVSSLSDAAVRVREEEWELAAFHLKAAVHSLGTITGEDASPDVLENIFSRFCIGK